MEKISAVYKIVNTVTKDSYIGSSKDVMKRWRSHKSPSAWKRNPNIPLYRDMQKYGVDAFRFQILAPVVPEHLKDVEQEPIEMLHPAYNDRRANGRDVEGLKEYQKKYQKEYSKTDKGKANNLKQSKKYQSRLCSYNGETLTLNALHLRFKKAGVKHPVLEAKKYLLPTQ